MTRLECFEQGRNTVVGVERAWRSLGETQAKMCRDAFFLKPRLPLPSLSGLSSPHYWPLW